MLQSAAFVTYIPDFYCYNKGIMNVCKGDDYNYGKQNYVK